MTDLPEDTRELAGYLFPLNGPHTEDNTARAASLVYELVRYLNYATANPAGLPYASGVGYLTGNIHGALALLDQTLTQTADRFRELCRLPGSYVTDARTGRTDEPAALAATHTAYTEAVQAALFLMADAARHLARAHSIGNRVGHNVTPEETP
jgi:hypothetical protein